MDDDDDDDDVLDEDDEGNEAWRSIMLLRFVAT